ncbi:MAG: 4'-phosphopantetheinyl transferase superfamily protein [Phaeospirillum sp.]|nr:4'-phosphopantetheinyl transferase superfamily protein [Phaeospirillum sp.]
MKQPERLWSETNVSDDKPLGLAGGWAGPRTAVNAIACWLAPLALGEEARAAALALLSPDETARANRFRSERDRWRFVAARASLRVLLGQAVGREPGRLGFILGPGGKPELDGFPIRFNLSHSGDWAAIAFSSGGEVGVDIEEVHFLDDLDGMISTSCSPREAAALAEIPPSERLEAFFQVWTRKEAYLKALGTGLAKPLESFSVTVTPGMPPRLEEGGDGAVSLMDLSGLAGYRGALVCLRRCDSFNVMSAVGIFGV